MLKNNKKKIMIIDDHLIVREGLKLIFETEDNYEVICEAENGKVALNLLLDIKPDLILVDINMPEIDGIEFITQIQKIDISIPVIILTTYNDSQLISKGLSLGAKGYLLKDTTRKELIRTIEAALRGETLLQPEIVRNIFVSPANNLSNTDSSYNYPLTEKELSILDFICRGCTSKEISIDLKLSERTVKFYLTNIYTKLNVNSRSEAVAKAINEGIIKNK
ncbi:response regulator [Acetoanaerobium sticklandii]|uniref:response regulator n=1 Tax=Acetoanaerobium sticklandii TaxID=1511 RepID=UPI003A9098D2